MQLAESQLKRLGEITKQTLSFYRNQSVAGTLDLVEIAESALRIHSHRLTSRSIEVRKYLPAKAEIHAMSGENSPGTVKLYTERRSMLYPSRAQCFAFVSARINGAHTSSFPTTDMVSIHLYTTRCSSPM